MPTVCAPRRTAWRTWSRRAAQGDVDQLGQPERSVAGEGRDWLERRFGVEVRRAVAAQQGGEDLGDEPASHRSEPDRGLVGGIAGEVLPRCHLGLGQDVGPQRSVAGQAGYDLRNGLSLTL